MTTIKPINVISDPGHTTCAMPLTIDPYGETCPYNCRYCYASGVAQDTITEEDLKALDTLLRETFVENISGQWHELLKKKTPIRIGYLRDPFPPVELVRKTTLRLITTLNRYDYPYILITKSDIVSKEPYLSLVSKTNASVHISITTLDENISSIIEPNASSPEIRLNTIRELRKAGIWTIARVNPLVQEIQLGKETKTCFTPQLLDKIKDTDANGLVIGFLNTPSKTAERFDNIFKSSSAQENKACLDQVAEHCLEIKLDLSFCWLSISPDEKLASRSCNKHDCCLLGPGMQSVEMSLWKRLSYSNLVFFEKLRLWAFQFLISKLNKK